MNVKILLLLITTTIPLFCFSQTELKNIDKSVKEIRDNLATYNKVEKINTKEGSRFAYLKDKDLKLITVSSIEPTIEKKVEWFYFDGQLSYAETNWFDITTGKIIFNEKCYLQNGHLISWTNARDKVPDPETIEFKKMEVDLVAYGKTIKDETLR